MWFKVDFNRLAILLLPISWRTSITVAYLQVLLSEINNVHYSWTVKRTDDWYKINHTGQVCKLRKVLNDTLDPDLRRIYIGEGNAFPRKYIYTHAENKPVAIGTMFIYRNSEYVGTGADFIVNVPAEIVETGVNQLHFLLKYYKLASKRYQIKPI